MFKVCPYESRMEADTFSDLTIQIPKEGGSTSVYSCRAGGGGRQPTTFTINECSVYHKDFINPDLIRSPHVSTATACGVTFHTRFLCLSASVFWLYHGSSRNGSLCHTYFMMVLISALLTRMQRYTMRNTFIDLKHKTTAVT